MSAKPKVLELTGGFPVVSSGLKAAFDHCALWEQADQEAFLAANGPSFRAVVCVGFIPLGDSIISKLPNLEIVAAFSAGTDNVDIQLLKSRGLRLTNTGGVHADSVGEGAVGLALAIARKVAAADRFVRDGRWGTGGGAAFPLTRQLCNKHVGIVGLGQIGAAIGKRMEGFGCTVAYWSRSPKPQYPTYVYYDNVVDLAKNSDILIVACALTDDTKKIIDRKVLDALGPQGFVVNVARGSVIDEQELVGALKEGRIAGAGLDVFENEPHIPHELMNLDTCVLQPHAGSATSEARQAMANMVVANLEAHFAGKPLLSPLC